MKYIDEFRDPPEMRRYVNAISALITHPWTIMEVCGGQTHAIVRHGLDELLPDAISLIHGPGCPVCVTPLELIDAALELASRNDIIFCSFGDMLKVPGSDQDLLLVKARGGDVRVVYSPLDALAIAKQNPAREVVFFAVGFETTAPANAMAVYQARLNAISNFSMLVSHVLVPPALEAILSDPHNRVQGILAAGHVCAIMGEAEYQPIAERYRTPIVVTGFEPLDILQGIYFCVRQLEQRQAKVETQYTRAVKSQGNVAAKQMIREVFEIVPRPWRGIGIIPESGLALRPNYHAFDAIRKNNLKASPVREPCDCICGDILKGLKKPPECTMFASRCTPDHPLGATMVSTEGTCAAYYQNRRHSVACKTIPV